MNETIMNEIKRDFPPLLTRGPALALLERFGVKRSTFDKWRAARLLRPVILPGNRREHYRRDFLLKLLADHVA